MKNISNTNLSTNTSLISSQSLGDRAGEVASVGVTGFAHDASRNNYDMEESCLSTSQLIPSGFNPNRLSSRLFKGLCEELGRQGINRKRILCRKVGSQYEIIAGEQTWRAAVEVGLEQVNVIVLQVDDYEARRLCVVENHRGRMDPLKYGRLIHHMLELRGDGNQSALAKALGVSEGTVRNKLKYVEFAMRFPDEPEEVVAKMSIRKIRERLSPADLAVVAKKKRPEKDSISIRFSKDKALGRLYMVNVHGDVTDFADVKVEHLELAKGMDRFAKRYGSDAAIAEMSYFSIFADVPANQQNRQFFKKPSFLHGLGAWLAIEWANRTGRRVECDASVQEELRSRWAEVYPDALPSSVIS